MFDPLFATLHRWQFEHQQRRAERLTAQAADLDADHAHDLLLLQDRGFVRARARGQSITQIHGEIENLIAKRLRVMITPGTYFVARAGVQNMVTRREYNFTLHPTATQSVSIDASCINAGRPIPGADDRFRGVRRVPDTLARFLAHAAANGADAMTVQAGTWTLTDGYSGADVMNHLVVVDPHGNRRQAVNDHHIREARRMLGELGIGNRL
jgi:hypothetical protein